MKKLDKLPVFRKRETDDYDPTTWRLAVNGLVRNPMVFPYKVIQTITSTRLTCDFACVEGWTVPDIKWEGVSIKLLAEAVEPLPEARYATFHAGTFVMSLALEHALQDNVILAYRMDGTPLPWEHGGPLRLVTPGNDCFYGVKWVERVEFSSTDANDTGREIALKRIGRA